MADQQLQESERQILGVLRATAGLRGWEGDELRALAERLAVEVVPRSEAEALAEALEVVVAYLRTDERRPLHTTIGQTCGSDICVVCSAEANAREAFDEYRSRHPKETP